ncbi:histidine phosphatase family protein [Brevibacillus sp. TJ4]|uniref:histidine phosphatase family protein n=1 Tax=Brevibacillus sp. TJ4 TaxID=3234853 RepID=UPI003BA14D4C
METIVYLVRHGETDWNVARRIQGHSDIDLNELGHQQAARLSKQFEDKAIHAVYSSDLSRARNTAAQIARLFSHEIGTLPSLRERCYGQWEGLSYEEIRERFNGQEEESYGIETFSDMQQRAVETLTQLAKSHPNEAIVVVSHGGLINSFLHYVTAGEQGTGISKIDNTGICVFRYSDQRWNVLQVNNTDHL